MRQRPRKFIRRLETKRMLASLGLQKKIDPITDILAPAISLFAVGALFGAAAAALMTPKSGPVLRRELADGAKGISRRLGDGRRRGMADADRSLQVGER